jgi:lipopolysaccharide/colanic/teichoic acid biosynthesis glycosyltransferase
MSDENILNQFGLAIRLRLMAAHHRTSIFFRSVIEKLLAAIFLLISLPLFIVVPVIIKLQDGGPVFYISRRMGKDRQLFDMYKFRSLAPQAEQNIGAQLLHHSHNEEIPIGRFLRDSRIDEIPQLLNIILGHMQFLGPRPERPALYAKHCAHITGYDKRFAVKPGLFGYSQLFTPHSTPKRIRTLIDNRNTFKNNSIGFVALWAPGIMFFLLLRMTQKGLRIVRTRLRIKYRMAHKIERRGLDRIRQSGHGLKIDGTDTSTDSNKLCLIDVNDECMFLYSSNRFPETQIPLCLKIGINTQLPQRVKFKTARVTGNILRHQQIGNGTYNYSYVISYSASTPLNRYLIDKYVLKQSIL